MITSSNWYMSKALDEAHIAFKEDEVPVGAVVVSESGEILASTRNNKEARNNPCGHAEILALTEAAKKARSWRLLNCSIFVTLEPCPMCLSAISQSRIKNLYFGAYDRKGGAISLGYNLHNDSRLNHKVRVYGGLNHFECSKILSDFFRAKRKTHS